MEFAISIVLILSVITNLITIHNIKNLQWHPVETELLPVLESASCDCGIGVVEDIKAVILPLLEAKPKATLPADDAYKAWKNRAEEPIVASPSPHKPPPIPEPLARPYGFPR